MGNHDLFTFNTIYVIVFFMGKRLTIEFVRESFEKEGFTLLSSEYDNCYQLLDFICPEGHEYYIDWNHWRAGRRCAVCSKRAKPKFGDIKKSFENENYTLISTEYINAAHKLDYICSNGHNHSTSWNKWQKGIRCNECRKNQYDDVKKSFENEGYILLSKEYTGTFGKLKFMCPNGHRRQMTWNSWNLGKRCGKCFERFSRQELEVCDFVKSIGFTFISNDRTIVLYEKTGNYLELDLWFPDIKKAIEYNGDYWHSREDIIVKDGYKRKWCQDNGIDLFVVQEQDWLNSKDTVKSDITGFLNGS